MLHREHRKRDVVCCDLVVICIAVGAGSTPSAATGTSFFPEEGNPVGDQAVELQHWVILLTALSPYPATTRYHHTLSQCVLTMCSHHVLSPCVLTMRSHHALSSCLSPCPLTMPITMPYHHALSPCLSPCPITMRSHHVLSPCALTMPYHHAYHHALSPRPITMPITMRCACRLHSQSEAMRTLLQTKGHTEYLEKVSNPLCCELS